MKKGTKPRKCKSLAHKIYKVMCHPFWGCDTSKSQHLHYEVGGKMRCDLTTCNQPKTLDNLEMDKRGIYRHIRIHNGVTQFFDAYRPYSELEIKRVPNKYWTDDLPVASRGYKSTDIVFDELITNSKCADRLIGRCPTCGK